MTPDHPYYAFSAQTPKPIAPVEMPWEFRKKGQDWVFLGETFWLDGDPSVNPMVVRAIQAFEPNLIPIWIKSAYLSPAGAVEVFTRHALGRYDPLAPKKHAPLRDIVMPVTRPAWRIPGKPHLIACIIEDRSLEDIAPGINVKPYMSLEWFHVTQLRKQFKEYRGADLAETDARDMLYEKERAKQARLDKVNDEAEYIFNDHWKGRSLGSEIKALTHAQWDSIGRTGKPNQATHVKGVA